VSSGTEHREFAESLAAYVLGAVPEEESARIREHLAGCHECHAELEWLRSAVDTLPASVPQVEPPPELRTQVMDIVEREAELLRAAGDAADRPERSPGRGRWWPSISGVRPSVVLVAACAAAIIVAGVILSLNSTVIKNGRTIHAQVTGPARVAGARASVRVTGSHAELVVSRLPTPAANHVDELWVQRGNGAPVPAGTFIVSSGSVKVEHPVRPGDHLLVTVEPGRGTRAPTSTPFIVAKA
jgi:anti-sigma-K factor RskA